MKALIYNEIFGYVGGIERYIHKVGSLLKQHNWELYGLFERKVDKQSDFGDIYNEIIFHKKKDFSGLISQINDLNIDVVFIHKISNLELLSELNKNFFTVVTVHDHDFYCFRKHKYFPIKRINCPLPQSKFICSICSLMIKKDPDSMLGYSFINVQHKVDLLKEIKDADATIVLSNYMRMNLEKNQWDMDTVYRIFPIHEISNETQVINEHKEYKAQFLFVGQLIRGKGVDLLIDACRELSFDYHLKIVGTGNDYDFLENKINLYGLHNKIELVGWTDQVEKYYQSCDLVIVPSRWQEPFGLIGIEAFSRKKAVVAFNVGGISDWLKHEENGILVKKHTPEALAKALEYAHSHNERLPEWGLNGYNFVKDRFNGERFMHSIKKIMTLAKEKF